MPYHPGVASYCHPEVEDRHGGAEEESERGAGAVTPPWGGIVAARETSDRGFDRVRRPKIYIPRVFKYS